MKEFAILTQLAVLRSGKVAAEPMTAIGLVAPSQEHVSMSAAASWLAQVLPNGLMVAFCLLAAVMLRSMLGRLSAVNFISLCRGRVLVLARRIYLPAPGTRRVTNDRRTVSASRRDYL